MIRKGFAIAGIRGGSGKTVVSLGLARALSRRGIGVAPFKKGPDYIDPAWLGTAAGKPCHNLDTFLFDDASCVQSFISSNPGESMVLLEGNRGLFDGYDLAGTHSTAELVKTLGIPLFLVVDCAKATRTIAAVVHGCNTFDPMLKLNGVILNNTSGERHRRITAQSVVNHCSLPVIGNISRVKSMNLHERHLGLQTVYEHPDPEKLIDELAARIENEIDINALIRIIDDYSYRDLSVEIMDGRGDVFMKSNPAPVIGVIMDEAFNFYYPENIDALNNCGADIVRLSAIRDDKLPDIDALYIGGGFPENHAEKLSANVSLRKHIRERVDGGMPVYAECGGLIYLSTALHKTGAEYPMVGVFPYRFTHSPRPVAHGYTVFKADRNNPYYDCGISIKGHEFRYSRIINQNDCGDVTAVFSMERGTGVLNGRDGLLYKNCMAAFCHTHALSDGVVWPEKLCALARTWRDGDGQNSHSGG